MVLRCLTLGLSLLLVGVVSARAAGADAVLSADGATLEDRDAGFRLRRPGPGWTLLPAAEARALHPRALVGARDDEGTRAVLVVHEGDVRRLTDVGDRVLETLDLEGVRVIQDVEVILEGKRARRILLEGRRAGQVVGYRITLTARASRVAEMRAWREGAGAMAAYVDLARFERGLTLLGGFADTPLGEGGALTRRRSPRSRDAPVPRAAVAVEPVPTSTTSDRVASGAYGFAVMPLLGWRLATSEELLVMNPEAEVGLIHQATEAYLVVLGEHVPADQQAALGPALRQATAARLGVDASDEKADAQAFGSTLSIDRYAVEGEQPLTFWHTVASHRDVMLQVLAWSPSALAAKGEAEVKAALRRLRWLTPDETALAQVAERRARTEQAEVGADWALRGVQYLDFAFGLRLRVRETTDWRLWAGEAADVRAPGARLVLDSPRRGCRVLLIPDPGLGLPSVVYHQAAVQQLWGAKSEAAATEPTVGGIGAVTVRTTAAAGPPGGPPTWVQLTTFRHEGAALQLLASGLAVNRDSVEAAAAEVLAALKLPAEGLEPSRRDGGVLIDEQFGFRLDAEGLRGGFRDVTPEAWRGRGRLITTALGEARLFVAAYAPGPSDDGEADPETLLKVLEAELKSKLPTTFVEGSGKLARRAATRLVLVGQTRRLHLLRLERGALTYVLGYAWDPRKTKPPVGQEERFELLP